MAEHRIIALTGSNDAGRTAGPVPTLGDKLDDLSLERLRQIDFVALVKPAPGSDRWPSWEGALRHLFRAGFVPTRLPVPGNREIAPIVFARSARLTNVRLAGMDGDGIVAMTGLGRRGRFGNQLFQYAFLKMYSLYAGASPAVPPWQGEALFGFADRRPGGERLVPLVYFPFDDDDLVLWEMDASPVNTNFTGYFQEIPAAWLPHRGFLRSLFTLTDAARLPLQATVDRLHDDGRTIVAIHVRQGDYLDSDPVRDPWFRPVPLALYRNLLAELWPQLKRPLLYVASDDPAAAAAFADYEQASLADPALAGVPDHVRDFFLLSAADVLALCNSSFSRMAALLADPSQRCFLPSFGTDAAPPGFAPYDAWADRAFWARRRGLYVRQAAGILGTPSLSDEEKRQAVKTLWERSQR
jgi:hypothetical protein